MFPKTSRIAIHDKLVGTGRNELRIRLAKNNPTPADADILLFDLAECDFDGYSFASPVWGAGTLDGDGVAKTETGVVEWTAGSGLAAPQTIHGVYATLTSPADGVTQILLWYERLASTTTLSLPGEKFRRVFTMLDTNYAP